MFNLKMNMPFYLMVFYGSIMIIAVLVLRGLLKNKLPKFVFPILWSVILLRLLVPFSLSSPLSMKVPEFAFDYPFETVITQNTAVTEVIPADAPDKKVEFDMQAEHGTSTMIPEAVSAQESTFHITYSDYELQNLYVPFAVFAYFAGILITAGILLAQKYGYSKRLKNSLLVEHNETINTLLRDMDMGHILVFTNDVIASPLVCGLFAPRIYLPTRMDFGNTELLHHILCHETMHIRRKDNWLKFIMLITLCIHWFNPLVWILSKYLASDLEMACDEAVLRLYDRKDEPEESKKSYALSLLAMAISRSRPTLLYSAFSKTEVEKRIQNILHYRKASALLLTFSICLVLSGSVVFATGGQAPFYPDITPFCYSDSCRWGVCASLTRDALLGKNAQDRAVQVIFDIMSADTTNDPDLLKEQIITALSSEFHVEKSAFALDISLCLTDEELYAEYEKWGLVRKDTQNDMSLLYNGETIRTYSDKMIGRYMSQQEGAVDLTVERSRLGEIVAINAYHEGDTEFDRRTRELEQSNRKYASPTSYTINALQQQETEFTETADNVVESR
ncbi:MAG: M56 family metallopeptidase [Lachnospiraceae bacterium]|nr:M56 family metallopeptidase [Lachnospiraceae bacterium]